MNKKLKKELVKKLQEDISKDLKIVMLPHFCIDNLVQYKKSSKSFLKEFKNTTKQKGGNIVVKQNLFSGGKASNCALALSSLGVHTYLIAKTSQLGYAILKTFFEGKNIDLSHVKKDGELAFTTALEFKEANIMVSDPGSLSQFGPKSLKTEDEKLISEADILCFSDWGLNQKGTELARHIFNLIKEKGGKTFFDPGDPSPKGSKKKKEIEEINNILKNNLVDILSVNEAEAKEFGKSNNFKKAINNLKKVTRVDLHTKDYAQSFYDNKNTAKIKAFDVQAKRFTGAGDAWNAGDILGEIMELSSELRILLANAVAAYYISDPQRKHPSKHDLINFLEK